MIIKNTIQLRVYVAHVERKLPTGSPATTVPLISRVAMTIPATTGV